MTNCQLESLLKFEDLDVWKRSARLSADIGLEIGYIHNQQGQKVIDKTTQTKLIQELKEIADMLPALASSLKLKT